LERFAFQPRNDMLAEICSHYLPGSTLISLAGVLTYLFGLFGRACSSFFFSTLKTRNRFTLPPARPKVKSRETALEGWQIRKQVHEKLTTQHTELPCKGRPFGCIVRKEESY
jgi:hypothetical protein